MDEGYGTRQWPKLRDAGVPALLRKAADVIDEHGFTQYTTYDAAGRVDVIGALRIASGAKFGARDSQIPPNTLGVLDSAIAFIESALDENLYVWNDDQGREKEHVAQTLRELADELDATI